MFFCVFLKNLQNCVRTQTKSDCVVIIYKKNRRSFCGFLSFIDISNCSDQRRNGGNAHKRKMGNIFLRYICHIRDNGI